MALQHLRSSTANKRPIPSGMSDGQLAVNSNLASPGLFFKDSNGDLVKTGPVHVGTTAPNATPAASGQTGNSKGEQWLDTSSGRYVFKIWDGTAWRSEDGEFVNASGDTMTGALVMDNRQQVRFRETTANGTNFVAIQAPASVVADRTLTLPDVTGTMVSTGDIGSVTSTMILDGTIVNADINASAAIAGTKISPNFGSQTITTTGVISSSLGAAGTPSIAFTGDLNTGIYSPGADQLAVATNGVERVEFGTSEVVFNNGGANYDFRVEGDTNANLFLVDASTDTVQVNGDITIADKIIHAGDTNTAIRFPAADVVAVETSGIERARIISTGRFLIGTPVDIGNGAFQVGQNTGTAATTVQTFSSNEASAHWLARSNANTIVAANDSIGTIDFRGYDGANYQTTALINSAVDGTPGTNDMPGRLVFSTTADGASSPTEHIRITSAGHLFHGTTTQFPGYTNTDGGLMFEKTADGTSLFVARGDNAVLLLARNTNDGDIVAFSQGGTVEGTISVSGTTISYNGAHLSRWSQLPSGAERTEILRGSVLSNLDEMCEWGEEDNEQLNRMKVSDVEGDKNVAGVFQTWDDDDDTYTNDFYCAMTGDFIIRIAEGVTVERGDLLMSAGDGTAKPQDDDIIRSKTIAKVTSTNVTCTYDDGSYCVPCVLMTC